LRQAVTRPSCGDAESVSTKIAKAFVEHPNWRQSEAALREVRKAVTFAVMRKTMIWTEWQQLLKSCSISYSGVLREQD
jgi:hypothetical protein